MKPHGQSRGGMPTAVEGRHGGPAGRMFPLRVACRHGCLGHALIACRDDILPIPVLPGPSRVRQVVGGLMATAAAGLRVSGSVEGSTRQAASGSRDVLAGCEGVTIVEPAYGELGRTRPGCPRGSAAVRFGEQQDDEENRGEIRSLGRVPGEAARADLHADAHEHRGGDRCAPAAEREKAPCVVGQRGGRGARAVPQLARFRVGRSTTSANRTAASCASCA